MQYVFFIVQVERKFVRPLGRLCINYFMIYSSKFVIMYNTYLFTRVIFVGDRLLT